MRIHLVATMFAVAVTGACTDPIRTPTEPDPINVPVRFETGQHTPEHTSVPHNFRTHLTGNEEVPPVDTRAQGQAIFQLSKDGTELSFKLIVANIQNVTQAHIHLGAFGVNGPVVVWLYPAGPPAQLIPGRFQGVLAEGVITEATTLFGPLAGQSLSDLLDAIRAGNTYVNVHTSQFPPGEIRGQID
jgi:hypothetical protein